MQKWLGSESDYSDEEDWSTDSNEASAHDQSDFRGPVIQVRIKPQEGVRTEDNIQDLKKAAAGLSLNPSCLPAVKTSNSPARPDTGHKRQLSSRPPSQSHVDVNDNRHSQSGSDQGGSRHGRNISNNDSSVDSHASSCPGSPQVDLYERVRVAFLVLETRPSRASYALRQLRRILRDEQEKALAALIAEDVFRIVASTVSAFVTEESAADHACKLGLSVLEAIADEPEVYLCVACNLCIQTAARVMQHKRTEPSGPAQKLLLLAVNTLRKQPHVPLTPEQKIAAFELTSLLRRRQGLSAETVDLAVGCLLFFAKVDTTVRKHCRDKVCRATVRATLCEDVQLSTKYAEDWMSFMTPPVSPMHSMTAQNGYGALNYVKVAITVLPNTKAVKVDLTCVASSEGDNSLPDRVWHLKNSKSLLNESFNATMAKENLQPALSEAAGRATLTAVEGDVGTIGSSTSVPLKSSESAKRSLHLKSTFKSLKSSLRFHEDPATVRGSSLSRKSPEYASSELSHDGSQQNGLPASTRALLKAASMNLLKAMSSMSTPFTSTSPQHPQPNLRMFNATRSITTHSDPETRPPFLGITTTTLDTAHAVAGTTTTMHGVSALPCISKTTVVHVSSFNSPDGLRQSILPPLQSTPDTTPELTFNLPEQAPVDCAASHALPESAAPDSNATHELSEPASLADITSPAVQPAGQVSLDNTLAPGASPVFETPGETVLPQATMQLLLSPLDVVSASPAADVPQAQSPPGSSAATESGLQPPCDVLQPKEQLQLTANVPVVQQSAGPPELENIVLKCALKEPAQHISAPAPSSDAPADLWVAALAAADTSDVSLPPQPRAILSDASPPVGNTSGVTLLPESFADPQDASLPASASLPAEEVPATATLSQSSAHLQAASLAVIDPHPPRPDLTNIRTCSTGSSSDVWYTPHASDRCDSAATCDSVFTPRTITQLCEVEASLAGLRSALDQCQSPAEHLQPAVERVDHAALARAQSMPSISAAQSQSLDEFPCKASSEKVLHHLVQVVAVTATPGGTVPRDDCTAGGPSMASWTAAASGPLPEQPTAAVPASEAQEFCSVGGSDAAADAGTSKLGLRKAKQGWKKLRNTVKATYGKAVLQTEKQLNQLSTYMSRQ